jgi:Leucine-rich repeat (LRR) protein
VRAENEERAKTLFQFQHSVDIKANTSQDMHVFLVAAVAIMLPLIALSRNLYSLSSIQYDALHDFYNTTGGMNWKWESPYDEHGYPWNFTYPPENPCSSSTPWQGVTCSSTCEFEPCNVLILSVEGYGLAGHISSSLGNLITVEILGLGENSLTGTIPTSLGNLKSLVYLSLRHNNLTGTIPLSFGNLTKLKDLYLYKNQLTGSLPVSLGNMSALQVLNVNSNMLTGTVPELLLWNLTGIYVQRNLLSGNIPTSIRDLPLLHYLICYLNQLTGTIPEGFGDSRMLEQLNAYENYFTGSIPEALGHSTLLQIIALNGNHLSSTLPQSLGNLNILEFCNVEQNHLSGTIPPSMGNMSSLLFLELFQNLLTGTIPSSLENLHSLMFLYLFQNRLTGTIPASLGNLKRLVEILLYENYLTGTLPSSFGKLKGTMTLLLNQNLLSGTIPNWLGDLKILWRLALDQNEFSGTIPSAIGNMEALENLYLNQNFLTGTIPSSLGNLSLSINVFLNTNMLFGVIPSSLTFWPSIELLYLFQNILSGTIPSRFVVLKQLRQLDLSENILSGSLPEGLFNNTHALTSIVISGNALTGTIPTSLFTSESLFSVLLAVNCFTGTLPHAICSSPVLTQLILDGLHSASSCSDKAIPGLSSSGVVARNSVHGHIPSCLLEHKHLSVLHLGGNSFSGSIPNVPINFAMTELVLCSNQLTGSIPDSIWQSNITRLDLSLNRLQGTLPSNMLPAAQFLLQSQSTKSNSNSTVSVKLQVNQLAGTIPGWLQSLPSDNIDVLEGNLFSCNEDRSNLPANDPKAATYECGSDNTNYGLIAFGAALLCLTTVAGMYRYFLRGSSTSGSVLEMTASFSQHYGESEVRKMWEIIDRAVYVIVGMWLLGMIGYGLLSLQFSSYAQTYIWAVSAIYKTGFIPAVTIFFWLAITSILWVNIGRQGVSSALGSIRTKWDSTHLLSSATVSKCSQYAGLCLVNIIVVTIVNGLFVSAIVSSKFSSQVLLMISFCLSVFKIIWNFFLMRVSRFLPTISVNVLVFLCLFNNILAPLLAEMFVSSDCFLYVVSQAPALLFKYNVYSCQQETGNVVSGQVCVVPILFQQGYGVTVEPSIIPPFNYSYQCSFSLLSSYVSVFIFHYILTGILEPLLRMFVFCIKFEHNTIQQQLVSKLLNAFWRTLLHLDNSKDSREMFVAYLKLFETYIKKGGLRQDIIIPCVIDLTMLICFGALFPPLAVIIALSILKDVMSIRLALGRYCEIMDVVEDESLIDHMVKVKQSMDEEMLKAGQGIWNGVWLGMVMGTWIWGFVLFDTMASTGGVGKGLCMVIGIVCCPLVIRYFLDVAIVLQHHIKQSIVRGEISESESRIDSLQGLSIKETHFTECDSAAISINNPIVDRESLIEMRISNFTKPIVDGKVID